MENLKKKDLRQLWYDIIQPLVNNFSTMETPGETYSYKGWLSSDSFLKRVFAVFGYGLVAQLLLSIIILIIALIISLAFGGLAIFSL